MMVLLLAFVAGNLAIVTVNKAVLDDVEAMAEWRIDGDAVDGELGAEPELPAALMVVREAMAEFVYQGAILHDRHHATALGVCDQATRGPPPAIPA